MAEKTKVTKCNKCGAEIVFIRTAKNNRWHPIDWPGFTAPCGQDFGSVVTDDGEIVNTTYKPFAKDMWVYNSHMGTCPEGEHQKKKQARQKFSAK